MKILDIIGRDTELFTSDLQKFGKELDSQLEDAKVLVVGAAGSIGSAVSEQLFKQALSKLHLIDINENNLVETVRNLRSQEVKNNCSLMSFVADIGSYEFEDLVRHYGPYDYVLNLAAMKHVRSERDPYSLSRMIRTNVIGSVKLNQLCDEMKVKKYFCVSTDKAADPVNAMGCSKRAMEVLLLSQRYQHPVSFARFANVAFSDGSLLDGFKRRIEKRQPLSAPKEISRYFITPEEAGILCLFSLVFGQNAEVFLPENKNELRPVKFEQILRNILKEKNLTPAYCLSEKEARRFFDKKNAEAHQWPVYLFDSDTSGEKIIETFSSTDEAVSPTKFQEISKVLIRNNSFKSAEEFQCEFEKVTQNASISKERLLDLLAWAVPEFSHLDTGKSLDERM
jgi:FlaA1/EpsC-like NDP-sugar epimerase